MTSVRQQLKRVPGLVPFVRTVRGGRIAVERSLEDARFLAGRIGRHKRIEAYLETHSERRLQLGAGSNLHAGWLNTDIVDYKRKNEVVYLDARRRFPLPDSAFDTVYTEHMIEHLSYPDGVRCLRECHRVLRPGGRIRVATPSLRRLARLYDDNQSELQQRYVRWAADSFVEHADAYLPGFVVNNFFRNWGHDFIYDEQTLHHALEQAGFTDVKECATGESDDPALVDLERHMRSAAEFNAYETMVLEAWKP